MAQVVSNPISTQGQALSVIAGTRSALMQVSWPSRAATDVQSEESDLLNMSTDLLKNDTAAVTQDANSVKADTTMVQRDLAN